MTRPGLVGVFDAWPSLRCADWLPLDTVSVQGTVICVRAPACMVGAYPRMTHRLYLVDASSAWSQQSTPTFMGS